MYADEINREEGARLTDRKPNRNGESSEEDSK